MVTDAPWTFINSKNPSQKITVSDTKSAQEFAQFLRFTELDQWVIEEKGGLSVRKCEELFSHQTEAVQAATAGHNKKVLPIGLARKNDDSRSQKRVEAQYLITIQWGDNVFKSYSKNVSSGGVLLTDPIPEIFHLHTCRILIDSGDNLVNLEFLGKVLSSSKSGSRIKFEEEGTHSSLKKLVTFIEKIEARKKSGKTFKIG